MNLERIFKALVQLGLSKIDSRIYLFLATKGSKRASEICGSLKISKQQLYPSLKNLQKRQVITVSNTRPLLFSALPFERVLDMLIKLKFDESEKITANKKELVTRWNYLDWDNNC